MFTAAISLALCCLIYHTKATSPTFEQQCLAFHPEQIITSATRSFVEFVPANKTLQFPDNDSTCNRKSQTVAVDLCRIAMSITTSEQSNIIFEAWLPEDWSGRFLATGNGGIDGCIKYEDIAYGSANGFATVGANNGKNGTGGLPCSVYHNPETVIDFAWRSLHTSVEAGKALTEAFYGNPHSRSYYMGCSLGGRQGVGAAEKFPGDFNGILAGAPGVDFNNLISWRAHFFPITGALNSTGFISNWKTVVHDEVLRQCDALDGAIDGIIENPSLCHFDPSTLLCENEATTACLSEVQVEQLRKIYSDYRYPDGQIIYASMQPGSEIGAATGLYAGTAWAYSESWFRYVVYNDPSWNALYYGFDDARAAEALNPGDIRTFPSALPAFEERGGKLLIYHGRQDPQITSLNTDRFYEHIKGDRSYENIDEWLRYFQISGMNHCSGGPGAWVLGQGGNAAAIGIPFTAQNNVLKAIVAWVEEGKAPEYMEGTKFVNDTVAMGVDFTRKHCRQVSPH
ncbi:feruloyl esterase B precursor [Phaeosphaeria sp. MPI-PUGE-AT-0046c]|nr:feruloyl esterase B precursor [Phaeosphaeria sp. MPI-PUGE-AT-0046c]